MVYPINRLKLKIFLIAGGNSTGIIQFPDASNRQKYLRISRYFMSKNPEIEQFGFLEGTINLQMSGGEFCGNAALVAARLIFELTGSKTGNFTISGFSGSVSYAIFENRNVECSFPGLFMKKRTLNLSGLKGELVDLKGIIYLILPIKCGFINELSYCKTILIRLIKQLGLEGRSAVGVIWQERMGKKIKIHPVVWVKAIGSFFCETACGSGTLATLIANDRTKLAVVQPSGRTIQVFRDKNNYFLTSDVLQIV